MCGLRVAGAGGAEGAAEGLDEADVLATLLGVAFLAEDPIGTFTLPPAFRADVDVVFVPGPFAGHLGDLPGPDGAGLIAEGDRSELVTIRPGGDEELEDGGRAGFWPGLW
jgi:hypothetical protein